MAEVASNGTKTKARGALLEMAKEWEKRGKIQHAIEGYEAVIEVDPEGKEAGQAKDALVEIAKKYDREGKKHSAYYLYHKLAG
ncbi:hypothetical protein KJ841_01420 [Patescibacteria group bacterium]|nr:hypothetical protein [Patescibacteria group bacterium]